MLHCDEQIQTPVLNVSAVSEIVCLFVGCLTSQQHASVSQGPHTTDNKIGTLLPPLPGAWCIRVSARTGWPCDWVR